VFARGAARALVAALDPRRSVSVRAAACWLLAHSLAAVRPLRTTAFSFGFDADVSAGISGGAVSDSAGRWCGLTCTFCWPSRLSHCAAGARMGATMCRSVWQLVLELRSRALHGAGAAGKTEESWRARRACLVRLRWRMCCSPAAGTDMSMCHRTLFVRCLASAPQRRTMVSRVRSGPGAILLIS
jgi:hypothetical protein